MVSNRLLQDCLEDFHNIMRLNMALYDRNCTCVAGEEEKSSGIGYISYILRFRSRYAGTGNEISV